MSMTNARRTRHVIVLAILSLIAVSCGAQSAKKATPTTTSPVGASAPQAEDGRSNSASRLVMWGLGENDVAALTDAKLAEWKQRGIDGFVVGIQSLITMGGDQDFTGDPNADLNDATYRFQRLLRDSNFVGRANAHGIVLYFSFYLLNRSNNATPLKDWFDDAGWSTM